MAHAYSSRYPLELAMADVVQRCLDAGAVQVDIAVEFAGPQSWIRIAADAAPAAVAPGDGVGESAPAVVVAPLTPAGFDVVGACLTLGTAVSISADSASAGRTVVQVEGLHDVLACKRQEGRVIESVLARMRTRITEALGVAFHRSLGGGERRRAPITITVNAEPVVPRDPVAALTEMTRPRQRELPFVVDGRVETVVATPHVQAPLDDDPGRGRQGFFVYLRDRLVQAGGWSRLTIRDRADAIARVAVDLPAAAVESFSWETAAHRVLFPASLVPALRAVAFEAVSAPIDATCALGMATLGGM